MDWFAIRSEESTEVYQQYLNDLGLFVSVCNVGPNLTSIHQINLKENTTEQLHGRVQQLMKIPIGKATKDEKFKFKIEFGDCYGFSNIQELVNLTCEVWLS